MATKQEILEAIRQADSAGNVDDAERLAELYRNTPEENVSEELDAGVGGFFESAIGGAKRLFSSAQTGVEAPFTSGEDAAISGIQRQQEITERPGASLEAAKETFKQEGILSGLAEVGSQIPTALAEQTPVLASIFGGSKLGTAVASGFARGLALPLPPQLKLAAGVLGSLIVPFLSMSGNNMQRKAEEDLAAGRPVDVDEMSFRFIRRK